MRILALLVVMATMVGCKHHPPLYVDKPCYIVAQSEDASGKFVEFTVRGLEYTGAVNAK